MALAGSSPSERRRLMGRLAALLFLGSGALVLVTSPLAPEDANEPGTIAVSVASIALGAFA